MGKKLPFSSEVRGSNRSRDDMCAPEGGRHVSGWSVGGGLHNEAFLPKCGRIILPILGAAPCAIL